MRPRDRDAYARLEESLKAFGKAQRPLPGIRRAANRRAFLEQTLESIHRVDFVKALFQRDINPRRADPNDELFDPLKAAILSMRSGNHEEGFWLVLLFVHFGKHKHAGWRYAREVYGRLGGGGRWDWVTTSADPAGFRDWLNAHQAHLRRNDSGRHGFGNHRKYESLDARSVAGTGAVVASYVAWVAPPRTHRRLIDDTLSDAGGDPRKAFDLLYGSMDAVKRFGRTARFDYLTMLGTIGLADIIAGSAYINDSTGPMKGAKLLFGVGSEHADMEPWLVDLDAYLNVGMQVLEDSLCNWQKSPAKFKPFRG